MSERLEEQTDSTDFQLLDDRVTELELAVLDVQRRSNQPGDTTTTSLNAALKRVTDVEMGLASAVSQTDLEGLSRRLELIESAQKSKMPAPSSSPPRPRPRSLKKTDDLSFQIFGRELRGGEEFLSVGPMGTQALGQARLIRVGESYLGWRLDAVDEQTAAFMADGITHRLKIRQEQQCHACN